MGNRIAKKIIPFNSTQKVITNYIRDAQGNVMSIYTLKFDDSNTNSENNLYLSERNIYGTHHAIDVKDLYHSLGVNCDITSSDITTTSQLLHSTRFNIALKKLLDKKEILRRIKNNELLAQTHKVDSNLILELGRRYGKYGRIYDYSIVLKNNLLVNDNCIKGWDFIPQ